MPTYEYRREDGSVFEVLQKMSDEPLKKCPDTGQKVERLIGGGSGLIFKGSGFYLTDYGRGGSGASPSETASAEGSSEDSGASSSESPSTSNSESSSATPETASSSDSSD